MSISIIGSSDVPEIAILPAVPVKVIIPSTLVQPVCPVPSVYKNCPSVPRSAGRNRITSSARVGIPRR